MVVHRNLRCFCGVWLLGWILLFGGVGGIRVLFFVFGWVVVGMEFLPRGWDLWCFHGLMVHQVNGEENINRDSRAYMFQISREMSP